MATSVVNYAASGVASAATSTVAAVPGDPDWHCGCAGDPERHCGDPDQHCGCAGDPERHCGDPDRHCGCAGDPEQHCGDPDRHCGCGSCSRPYFGWRGVRKFAATVATGVAAAAGGAAGGAAAASTAGLVTLKAVGFTATGPAAASWAAGWMSSTAIANGGGVAAGSLYAVVQSVSMGGMAGGLVLASPVVLGVGAVAGAATGVTLLALRRSKAENHDVPKE